MILTALGTAIILLMGAYLALTLVLAVWRVRASGHPVQPLRVVFVVPALNEARVIRNTLDSLLAVRGRAVSILVIDDGSDDATAEIVSAYPPDRVWLLRRELPDARRGKGQALNHAYRMVRDQVIEAGLDPASVVLCIVDGDGRLSSDVLDVIEPCFADPQVGAVQIRVRIYNRAVGWLPRFQDYEFLTFSSLVQRAREHIGSVGLGGNGQFTRLSALMDLGDDPWTDCLTEDLDLGLRLAMAGWRNRFTAETEVAQQGLVSVSRIVRQRTRWMQGHMQCWRRIPALIRSDLPTFTVLDLLWYLAAPITTLLVSLVFGIPAVLLLVSTVIALTNQASIGSVAWLLPLYVLSFGPSLVFFAVYWHQAKDISAPKAFLLAHVLTLYNYVWYLATWKALGRLVTGRNGWSKTTRLADEEDAGSSSTEERRSAPDSHGHHADPVVSGFRPDGGAPRRCPGDVPST